MLTLYKIIERYNICSEGITSIRPNKFEEDKKGKLIIIIIMLEYPKLNGTGTQPIICANNDR